MIAVSAQKLPEGMRKVFGFLIAGGIAMGVDLAIFNSLMSIGLSRTLSNLTGAFSALVVNYLINHEVFLPKERLSQEFKKRGVRFGAVAAFSFVYTTSLFEAFATIFAMTSQNDLSLLRVSVVASGTVIRYLLLRFWVFRVHGWRTKQNPHNS